jgi:hypothetical protein
MVDPHVSCVQQLVLAGVKYGLNLEVGETVGRRLSRHVAELLPTITYVIGTDPLYLEAGVGIEPAYTDLQSAAWPLCHPAAPRHYGKPSVSAGFHRRAERKWGSLFGLPRLRSGAGNESRTRDLNLGKVALYQLSYSRRF